MTKIKNSFKVADFTKTLKTNSRFMENLERKITKVKKPGLRIYVAMNVLSNHSMISDIKTKQNLIEVSDLVKIENQNFRLGIQVFGENERIYFTFPLNKSEIEKLDEDLQIKKVYLEYNILFDAASSEAQKKYLKQNKTE